MLRFLTVFVLGVALLASSLGFANSFAINSNPGQAGNQDISSGTALVGSCNGNVEVNLTANGYVAAQGDFIVDKANINADPTCGGDTVKVQLTTTGNAALGGPSTATLDAGGDAAVDFSAQSLKVSDVIDVHVAIY